MLEAVIIAATVLVNGTSVANWLLVLAVASKEELLTMFTSELISMAELETIDELVNISELVAVTELKTIS